MPTCNFSCADEQSDLSVRVAHISTCNLPRNSQSDLSVR